MLTLKITLKSGVMIRMDNMNGQPEDRRHKLRGRVFPLVMRFDALNETTEVRRFQIASLNWKTT